ncbi:dihydroxyacetone kinase subunit DhaL [Salinifilum aidingensis]
MGCSARDVAAALHAAATAMSEHREELIELDRHIGDADHGENLDRGFRAVASKLDTSSWETPAAVLKLGATVLISTVGGASGPLYGTALLRAATSAGEAAELDGQDVAAALQAAVDGVAARGKAEVEDKTMIDALTPAARAAREAAELGSGPADVLATAAEAAQLGAERTEPMIARKGRASYLGDRSAGHLDPGARSTALLLHAMAETARKRS